MCLAAWKGVQTTPGQGICDNILYSRTVLEPGALHMLIILQCQGGYQYRLLKWLLTVDVNFENLGIDKGLGFPGLNCWFCSSNPGALSKHHNFEATRLVARQGLTWEVYRVEIFISEIWEFFFNHFAHILQGCVCVCDAELKKLGFKIHVVAILRTSFACLMHQKVQWSSRIPLVQALQPNSEIESEPQQSWRCSGLASDGNILKSSGCEAFITIIDRIIWT